MELSPDLNPEEFLQAASWLIVKGISYSKHPFHEASFATAIEDSVTQRCVVIRRWVLKRRTLMFHTDYRSPKIKQVMSNPNTSLLFYSKPDKLQLRFGCVTHFHYKNRLSKYMFSLTTESQQACYRFPYTPSSVIQEESKEQLFNKQNKQLNDQNPYDNFAVGVSNFNTLDLLYLHYKGHVRIHYNWDKYGELSYSYKVA